MSRSNIVAQGPVNKEVYVVVFQSRNGYRAYQYDMVDGLQIAAGGDPHNYQGEEVDALTVLKLLGETVEDLAEVLA
jgi:hypothetical protein